MTYSGVRTETARVPDSAKAMSGRQWQLPFSHTEPQCHKGGRLGFRKPRTLGCAKDGSRWFTTELMIHRFHPRNPGPWGRVPEAQAPATACPAEGNRRHRHGLPAQSPLPRRGEAATLPKTCFVGFVLFVVRGRAAAVGTGGGDPGNACLRVLSDLRERTPYRRRGGEGGPGRAEGLGGWGAEERERRPSRASLVPSHARCVIQGWIKAVPLSWRRGVAHALRGYPRPSVEDCRAVLVVARRPLERRSLRARACLGETECRRVSAVRKRNGATPAASYSPTRSPKQYHRRWRA